MRSWSARCGPFWCIGTLPGVGGGKMPNAKNGPQVLKRIHERMVQIAQAKGVTTGRRMRVDTTVVETNIHHPTDSTLLGDGVRVLIHTMKKITQIAGAVGTKLRDRSRSVKFRLLEIGRVARAKGAIDQDNLQRRYEALLDVSVCSFFDGLLRTAFDG